MKEKFIKGSKWFFQSFIWLGILMLIIDIVTKLVIWQNHEYILNLMNKNGHGIELIPGFLAISYLRNRGAAFGLSTGNSLANRIIYIVIATAIFIAIIVYFVKNFKKLSKLYRACLMLIAVGAIGNLIDRLFFGFGVDTSEHFAVIDWINFYGIWKYNFNIADSCIVIGVIMLIVILIIQEVKDYKAKPKEPKPTGKVLSKDEQARVEPIENSEEINK